jgi:hypothetical protein
VVAVSFVEPTRPARSERRGGDRDRGGRRGGRGGFDRGERRGGRTSHGHFRDRDRDRDRD